MATVVYLRSANRTCPCGRQLACTRAEMRRNPDAFFFVMTRNCNECGMDVEVDTRLLAMETPADPVGCLVCGALDTGLHQHVTCPAPQNADGEVRGLMCPGCLAASLEAEAEAYDLSLRR